MAKKNPSPLPEHIDIMGVRFRACWNSAVEDGARADFDGDGRTIRVAPHGDLPHHMGSSALHEVLHGILYVSGLEEVLDRRESGLDETVVRTIEAGLFPLLKLLASIPAK